MGFPNASSPTKDPIKVGLLPLNALMIAAKKSQLKQIADLVAVGW